MKRILSSLLGLTLFTSAIFAQVDLAASAETADAESKTANAPTIVPATPLATVYNNGPLATGSTSRSGVAAPAGTQWSEVSYDFGSTTAANTLSGFGCQKIGATTNNRCADDFTVPCGQTWTVDKVTTYAYQTGFAGATSPLIAANVQIWNGRPGDAGSSVIAGNPTSLPFTSTDVLLYRIFNSGPPLNTIPGTTRRVWENTITLPAAVVLTQGTYWIDFQIDAGALGNFSPPVTITGMRTVPGWNGRQFIGTTGLWSDALDTGTPATEPDVAQDMAFRLEGPVSPLQLTTAVSRKTHGTAGDFDVPLPLCDAPQVGVECRSSGDAHTLILSFSNNIVSGSASVTAPLGGSISGSPILASNTITVNLTGVTDVQKITVTLSGVMDSFAQVLPDTAVSMNVLPGDTNGNKSVSASDIGQTKAQSGIPVTGVNFRQDVTPNGTINASDIGLVKSRSGQSVP